MKKGIFWTFRKAGVLLAVLFVILGSVTVSAALKPDADDPDYIKRTSGYFSGDEVDPSWASQVDSSKYVLDTTANKYTGLKYYHSSRFKNYDIAYGIDVSKWNGRIDWNAVKADGISFAFLRIGYSRLATGTHNKDEMYDVNLAGVKKAGIPFGVYYFSQAITVEEAKSEAKYVLQLLRNEKLSLPVVFDSEETEGGRLDKANLSKSTYTAINLAFCQTIEEGGYPVIIYNGVYGFNNSMNTAQLEDKYEFWLARYNTNTYYDGKYSFWQYSSTGKVSGISGTVDVNFWYRKKDTPMPVVEDPGPVVKGVALEAVSDGSIKISWTALAGAQNYEIWRSNSYDGVYDKITVTSSLSYTDSGITAGWEYFYQVRPVTASGTFGSFSEVKSQVSRQTVSMQVVTTQDVNLKEHAGANYETIGELYSGTLLGVLSVTRNVDGNTWYQVKALVDGDTLIGYVSARQADIYIGKGAGLKMVKSTRQTITLKWKPLPGANGYYLYRSTAKNGTYSLHAVITGGKTTYTDRGLKTWCQYYYRVKGFNKVQEAVEDKVKEKEDSGTLSAVCAANTKKITRTMRASKKTSLYKYAGSSYRKLVTIPKGTKAKADYRSLDKRGKWWYHVKVTVNNKTYEGYVVSSYVK